MMRTVKIPLAKLQDWLGEEAEIFDTWMTCDPRKPELVVVVKSDDMPRRHRRRDLETEQLRLEAALDRTMMNHA